MLAAATAAAVLVVLVLVLLLLLLLLVAVAVAAGGGSGGSAGGGSMAVVVDVVAWCPCMLCASYRHFMKLYEIDIKHKGFSRLSFSFPTFQDLLYLDEFEAEEMPQHKAWAVRGDALTGQAGSVGCRGDQPGWENPTRMT